MNNKTLISEAAIARVIKQAGKYVIKKPDGSIDPKTFRRSEDAIRYRNETYYNRQQVEKGKSLSKRLGADGDEYLKDTGTLPKRDPSGKLYKRDEITGKTTYYSSYSDWAKRSGAVWARGLGNAMPRTLYRVAEYKALLRISTWSSIAIIVANWYDEVEAVHAAYAANEIGKQTAENAIRQITEEAMSKGVTAIIGGKLLGVLSRGLVYAMAKMFNFKPALTNWMLVAAGPVQKQITTYLVANEVIAKNIMMSLLNAPGISDIIGGLQIGLTDLVGAGQITDELEQMRAGQSPTPNNKRSVQQQPDSSSGSETPVVSPNTPAGQNKDSIDWLNDSPEEIERKWKMKS